VEKMVVEQVLTNGGLLGVGAGLAIGLGAVATGIAQGSIGAAGLGMIAEKESSLPLVILFVAIPETLVILGFVIAFILIGKMG